VTIRPGDRTVAWRDAYARVGKNPLTSVDRTNRSRLRALGFERLDPSRVWLDVGAGDGNVSATLVDLGVRCLASVEVQPELARRIPGVGVVVGDARHLPVVTAGCAVALLMDVLHHVRVDELDGVLAELARVVRPGGHLLVCEPSPTVVRRILTVLLDSPLASFFEFSRDKRRMVDLEADTLVPWLDGEPGFVARAADVGFELEHTARRPLHTLRRFRAAL
jgi:SAM-dependent methyltransferase